MASDFIAFTEGDNYLLQSGFPATVYFLLSTKACSGAGSHAVNDTLAGGIGEITGTGYVRQSQARPTPSSGALLFSQMSWDTDAETDWPASVKSCVAVTTVNNSGKALCAWNLQTGGAPRDLSQTNTTQHFTPTLLTSDAAPEPTPWSDNFNRADGAVGSTWTAMDLSALHIASNEVIGDASQIRGMYRTGDTSETYGNDHYSQITISSTALPLGDWIGPAVRVQSGGNCYAVLYFWDTADNRYRLNVYKRISATWTQIDATTAAGPPGYTLSGPLSAGDVVRLAVVGSTLYVYLNGDRVAKVTDTSIASGGKPGIVSYGAAAADTWTGHDTTAPSVPNIQTFTSAPPNSANNGGSTNHYHITVLEPDNPAPGVAHKFIYVLAVDPDLVTTYGDGMDTLAGLNIHNKYNATLIQPAFAIGSWYANHTTDPTLKHETYMVSDLVPWVTANFATSGTEEHWLIGFSRSGFGGMGLLFKHPTVFDKCAAWDWPFDMNTANYAGYSAGPTIYGSDANFANNYQMTSTYLDTYKTPFQSANRIWIQGSTVFGADVDDADTQLTAKGVLHTKVATLPRGHRWDTGWVPDALAALAA